MPLPARKTNADPFANETPQAPKPSAKPSAAMQRAADFIPTGEQFYLKDIEGQEVAIYTITPGTDSYGVCCDLLVTTEGDEEGFLVHVSGYLAGRLVGLKERIDSGECGYPLAAKFDKITIGGGKTVWRMS